DAWFVSNVKMVANPDSEITAVKTFNPASTAVVDKVFQDKLGDVKTAPDPNSSIRLTSYEPNDLKYESNSSSEQFAVFSEVYYDKGWNAYIDGKEAPYVRADFVLRAMKVPAGKHEIEFKFEPSFYYTGEKIALAGSILLFLMVGGGIYAQSKKMKKEAENEAA
ncbi:MAG TPA: YfhO family protein, partial [Bacteroidia bacterium]|nr:YfhO family protein [Bacteroidia bacterium]